jgi:hypothetical protein
LGTINTACGGGGNDPALSSGAGGGGGAGDGCNKEDADTAATDGGGGGGGGGPPPPPPTLPLGTFSSIIILLSFGIMFIILIHLMIIVSYIYIYNTQDAVGNGFPRFQ